MREQALTRFPLIRETVARYYAERLGRFGPTPRGVDWNSAESQAMRFDRLLEVIDAGGVANLIDYGCGYGALVEHIDRAGFPCRYTGFDISESMIASAKSLHGDVNWCSFTSDGKGLQPAAYTVASGIFNVKLHHSTDSWLEYTLDTLGTLDELSTRAFAFNMLSTYSEPEKRRQDLFYMDPTVAFDFCKKRFSSRVALLHDYPLFEFTIIVRK